MYQYEADMNVPTAGLSNFWHGVSRTVVNPICTKAWLLELTKKKLNKTKTNNNLLVWT